MTFKSMAMAGAAALALLGASGAQAIINAPVPTNATIKYAGLQWAWASPLDFSSIDLTYQSTQGWRLPTAAELTNAPSAQLFKFAGANVPLGGSDPVSGANWQYTAASLDGPAALATPYFSAYGYLHGDWCNGVGSACGFGEVPWAGQSGAQGYSESLVVRDIGGVPEAATWVMLIAGFGLVGAAMRRRAPATVAA